MMGLRWWVKQATAIKRADRSGWLIVQVERHLSHDSGMVSIYF